MIASRRTGCVGLVGLAVAVAAIVAWLLPPAALVLDPGPRDPRLVRGSLHVHTVRSDGAGTVDDVARAAHEAGLDFVVIADHGDGTRTPDPAHYQDGVLCIDAVEISTTGGHYLALGLDRTPYRLAGEPRDVVEDVARLGGFGIVTHPASPKPELAWGAWDAGPAGLEWLNADSAWRDEGTASLARALTTYFFRAPETIAALFSRDAGVFAEWDRLTRERPVVAVAGHDAHARIGLRGNWEPEEHDVALRLPGYASAFRAFAVRVRLDAPPSGDAGRDARALLAALRAGHAFTVLDALAGPAALSVTATGAAGTAAAGDTLIETGPVQIAAQATDAPGLHLTLFRDGAPVKVVEGPALRFTHPGGLARAVYRVEAHIAGRGTPGLPWIVGNPIYLGAPPEAVTTRSLAISRTLPLGSETRPGAWVIERESRSDERLSSAAGIVRMQYRLAPGLPSGQYAAAALPLVRGQVQQWDQMSFTASAAAPMRLSVQLREPAGNRWVRSVYVDTAPRPVTVRFDDMRPAEPASPPHPRLENVDSLLMVVDTVNTTPGTGGDVRFGDLRLERLAAADQVRTVSNR